jgi:hypothetical protein
VPTAAVISINGVSESVASGMNFPAASQLFQLVALTAHTATVAIVGGSYASGTPNLKLKENKPVTLVNTADGTRYTLVLYPQGTPAPGATGSTSSGSSTPVTPVTPVTPSTPVVTPGG